MRWRELSIDTFRKEWVITGTSFNPLSVFNPIWIHTLLVYKSQPVLEPKGEPRENHRWEYQVDYPMDKVVCPSCCLIRTDLSFLLDHNVIQIHLDGLGHYSQIYPPYILVLIGSLTYQLEHYIKNNAFL